MAQTAITPEKKMKISSGPVGQNATILNTILKFN